MPFSFTHGTLAGLAEEPLITELADEPELTVLLVEDAELETPLETEDVLLLTELTELVELAELTELLTELEELSELDELLTLCAKAEPTVMAEIAPAARRETYFFIRLQRERNTRPEKTWA